MTYSANNAYLKSENQIQCNMESVCTLKLTKAVEGD